jgi:hypothetical protein
MLGVWRPVMACWALVAAVRGAEPPGLTSPDAPLIDISQPFMSAMALIRRVLSSAIEQDESEAG